MLCKQLNAIAEIDNMKYTLALIIIILQLSVSGQEKYSKVKIDLQESGLRQIAILGIDVTEGSYSKAKYLEIDLGASELKRLNNAGIRYSIIHENVSEFYAKRAANDKVTAIDRSRESEWAIPENWEYGSMGNYYTLSEVMDELDAMHDLYPALISERQPLSTTNLSHEGRMQYWVKISDYPTFNENEPEVLYTGVHHAREPMSVQQTIFYMWYLLENYESDEEIRYLVDNTEMYFVPVINPDGYEYNYQTNPNGGGMWRKNRRDNGGGSFGVDPNRNYGYMWGLDNTGSSPNPDDLTYRGPEAFSEPEIQNIRDFCDLNEFKIALNYHSYSDLLLYTWGWSEEPCEHNDMLHDFSVLMTKENNYVYGPGSTTIYPTNGGSDDWMYGEQETKDVIFSFTPEVGSSSDGFWPTTSRIIPLCQEQMWQNISAARLVGKYAVVNDLSPVIVANIDGFLPFNVKRLGLTEADLYTVSITPLDNNIVEVGNPISFNNLELMEINTDSIEYSLNSNIEPGTAFRYLLSVDNGDYIVSDTIEKVFGSLVTIFEDECNDMENWTSNKWNVTTSSYHTAPSSITDSPFGEYQDNEYNIITLDSVIDFTEIDVAYAQFWAKWEIESGYDYVQFMAKDINSGGWVSLQGKYTRVGTQYQQEGEPVYDGFTTDWNFEEVDLSDFAGKQAMFRFIFVSDQGVTEDGFYFDNFSIRVISDITDIPTENTNSNGLFLADAFPNPSNNLIIIKYQLENDKQAMLEIIDLLGNVIISKSINKSNKMAKIDVSNINNGVYFYRISTKATTSETKRFIKQ